MFAPIQSVPDISDAKTGVGKVSSMDTTERTAASTLSRCDSCLSKGAMLSSCSSSAEELFHAHEFTTNEGGVSVDSLNASVLAAIVLLYNQRCFQKFNDENMLHNAPNKHTTAKLESNTTCHRKENGTDYPRPTIQKSAHNFFECAEVVETPSLPKYLVVSTSTVTCENASTQMDELISQNSLSSSDTNSVASSCSSSNRSSSTSCSNETLMSYSSSDRSSCCRQEYESDSTEDIFIRRERILCQLLKKARNPPYCRYMRDNHEAAWNWATKNEKNCRKVSGDAKKSRTIEEKQVVPTAQASMMSSVTQKVWHCIIFELFHAFPAYCTQILYCFAHVAFFELICLVMGEHLSEIENECVMYAWIMALSLLLARISGSAWAWLNDDNYDFVKFDMRNKLYLRHADARLLLWFKKHETIRETLEILSLYLCHYASYYFVGQLALKSLFDIKEDIAEDLPSMKYPDISTHIKNVLVKGELAFEDAADSVIKHVPESSQCNALGKQYCTADVLEICNAFEKFRANLTEADADYLWKSTTVDSYYKVIGDVGAGIYDPGTVVCYFMIVSATCTFLLKKIGVGFWDR